MAFPPKAPKPQSLTPLTKGGQVTRHQGKGSQMAPMPAGGMNSFPKAAPPAMGAPAPAAKPMIPAPGGGGFGGL
jgi:hypothetical protein